MIRKFPHYKGNRVTSKTNNRLGGFSSYNKKNPFKQYIDRIHKIDRTFKNHLTFYHSGESDFKIGYILQ
jgi:hypothetical protein